MATRIEPNIGDGDVPLDEPARKPALPADNAPRKVWIAAALTPFFPFVAMAYAGSFTAALFFLIAYMLLSIVFGQTGLVHVVAGTWLAFACLGAIAASLLVLPSWLAFERRERFRRHWYNHWVFYVVFGLATSVLFLFTANQREVWFGFGIYRTPSSSMQPTLEPGDIFVVDSRGKTLQSLRAGDIVVYESTRKNVAYVKRLVALPGQRVQIDTQGVRVDGKLVPPPTDGADVPLDMVEYRDVELAYDQYYFIGDSRGNSVDSRMEGPVPRSRLHGKVTVVWPANDRGRLRRVDVR